MTNPDHVTTKNRVASPAPVQRGTILFLDDEESVLTSLRSVFRREGYTQVFFRRSAEALGYLKDQSVDVVVADLKMPDTGGTEFLAQAAALCPDAVRIILSGYEERGVVLDALAKGTAQHYILKPWEDGAFRDMVAQSVKVQRELRDSRLRKILGDMELLPSPPKFHVRLKALMSDLENPIKEIVAEIEKSPALLARILRVANSVFYGPRRPISTVREAVIFIGLEYVAGLVMAIEAFQNVSRDSSPESSHQVEEIWDLSLQRARIAKTVAEKWPGVRDPHVPYVTALLMDIGYVVRIRHDLEAYLRYQHLYRTKEMTKYEADAHVFGITHDAVGAALLQYWNFPPEITHAVGSHHRKEAVEPLTQIVQIADGVTVIDLTNPHDTSLDHQIVDWRRRLADVGGGT